MQNGKVLALVGCLMVLTATVADHSVKSIAIPTARRVPVESFPLRFGGWTAGPRLAVDDGVQEKLATATILEHVYTNSRQQSVDCMLVTASSAENLHDPTMCFPAQGWRLGDQHSSLVAGQPVQVMTATLDRDSRTVMYWIGGYQPPPPPRSPVARILTRLRLRLLGTREGNSLFVRLMVPDTDEGRQTLTQFASQIMPQIRSLTSEAGGRKTAAAFAPSPGPALAASEEKDPPHR